MRAINYLKYCGFLIILLLACIIYVPFILLGLIFGDPFGIYRELFYNAYLFKKKHFPDL